ncbi:MAG: CDP-glucose 4,6-dehydratase [Clostridiales bacterium]|nr:CDP-glucose 4,6-dehydratase [Clostridiales bacterium]
MNKAFWKNKKVLITGNTGFKGSWLSRILLNACADVYGYALPNECQKSIFNAIDLEKEVKCCYGDICDEEKLGNFIAECKPDVVFHLAAQPIVRLSYEIPVETYKTNVLGTAVLLNSLRKSQSVKAIVNVTTDKVYENNDKNSFFSERDRLGGYDPYSNSKACSELVTSSFVSSFFNPEEYGKTHSTAIATARAGNVIGGGDFAPDRLVPDLIRAYEKGEAVVLRNPNSVRPWQNVLEPLSLYIELAQRLYEKGTQYNGAYNIGPRKEDCLSVIEVIKKFSSYIPLKFEISSNAVKAPHEAKLLTLNSQKAYDMLGFKDKWDIDSNIEYTALWYKKQIENENMKQVTDDIISTYFG